MYPPVPPPMDPENPSEGQQPRSLFEAAASQLRQQHAAAQAAQGAQTSRSEQPSSPGGSTDPATQQQTLVNPAAGGETKPAEAYQTYPKPQYFDEPPPGDARQTDQQQPYASYPAGGQPPYAGGPGPQQPQPASFGNWGDWFSAGPFSADRMPIVQGYPVGDARSSINYIHQNPDSLKWLAVFAWVLFALGFFFPFFWIVVALLPCCIYTKGISIAGFASSIMLLIYCVIFLIALPFGRGHGRWHYAHNNGY